MGHLFLFDSRATSLREYGAPAADELAPTSWPPEGYEGASQDGALAVRLAGLLGDFCESSARDVPYFAFVIAPDDEIPGVAEALERKVDETLEEADALLGELAGHLESSGESFDQDGEEEDDEDDEYETGDLDPTLVMLGYEPDEIEEMREDGGASWWEEWWDEEEYRARLAVGRVLATELSEVERVAVPVDGAPEWSVVYYEGTSKSGATVGLLSIRHDPD